MPELKTRTRSPAVSTDTQVALVTGGAMGIGQGCVEVFGRAGYSVIIVDVDRKAGSLLAQKLRENGTNAEFVHGDVTSPQSIKRIAERVKKQFGRLDVLVNNAGTHDAKGIEECTLESWDRLMKLNLRSVFLVTQSFLPLLKRSRGVIINIASQAGIYGQKGAAAYSATKGGIISLTKSMALDLAPSGVRVNAISPGAIDTPLLRQHLGKKADKQIEALAEAHTVGRIGIPADVGEAALFLASPRSQFVNGINLLVDGGPHQH